MRILNPEKLDCYAVDSFLGSYFVNKKKLPLLSIKDGKYYFAKNKESEKVIRGEIPIIYKFCSISETKGGE